MSKLLIAFYVYLFFYTVWVCYQIIKHKYGKRIKEYFVAEKDRRGWLKLYDKQQEERRAKIGKRLEVQHVDVEDMGLSSAVFYDKSGDVTTFTTELIIINK